MEEFVKVTKKRDGNVCTIYIDGFLDYSTIDPFTEEIISIEESVQQVIIDCSELEFIDSTGIGAIINLLHVSREKKFQIQLDGMNEAVKDLFQTIGLFEIMKSFNEGGN
ncbi:STAS domain-containing protein [Radiobacillus deserti]|uniref:Anti-sigma factor antagonist n=1 Tax=Radiobacillus deserti TaxID=2594883 RepID=A0A516KDR0_9BACI|nr:STAS domain-containing protein [Radiobacillus deserti]QDP39552.1 STAS domain-containing protein [Radiobacillus deserti]